MPKTIKIERILVSCSHLQETSFKVVIHVAIMLLEICSISQSWRHMFADQELGRQRQEDKASVVYTGFLAVRVSQ